jgi:Amino acid synthesis
VASNCVGPGPSVFFGGPNGSRSNGDFRRSGRSARIAAVGVAAPRPVARAVGMAVIANPFAGRFVDDLQPLFEAGATLGERLMPELVKLLDGPTVSYGKGALVGVNGEMEMAALASTRCWASQCGPR